MSGNPRYNKPLIQRYGEYILADDPDIILARKTFNYDIDLSGDDANDMIIEFINRELLSYAGNPITSDHVKIIHKDIPDKGLNWHIDDCQVVSMKEPPTYKLECYKRLSNIIPDCNDNKYLYFNPDTPTDRPAKYTVLFYSSSWGIDFQGGELFLADGVKIRPMKGTGIMMDTREAHMVSPVRNGIRKVCLVKIY